MNIFTTIKQKVAILDVISEYATLKKAGLYWKGCCPFHHERTPSFTVSPHKEIFYCFGCHAGGDVISFIAKAEHCSALEAAQHLVERYNIEVPNTITWEKSSDTQEAKNLYYKTCLVFAHWCAHNLTKSDNALNYLQTRSITQESIQAFLLGYCPIDVKGLLAFGQKQDILATNFIDAHILIEGKHGLYSPFEERIIFPIKDHIGRFVGFGGRIFAQGDERAKYYNSHDHAFFNKGTTLYGLDISKKNIAQEEAAFLVEGYTDLILMHQYGYKNVVATLGTACTQDHLKQLARYAQRIYILYDGDNAGQNAIIRLAELCWKVALDPYVITLPTKDDPATFLLQGGNLSQKTEQALDIFKFIITYMSTDYGHKSLQERVAITKKIITIIATLDDPLKRDILLAQASEAFTLPLDTIKREFKMTASKKMAEPVPHFDDNLRIHEISQLEKKLFSAILYGKQIIKEEDTELLHELLPEQSTLLLDVLENPNYFETASDEEKAVLSGLMIEGTELSTSSFDELLMQFYKKQWKRVVHDVKLRVSHAQDKGDNQAVKDILTSTEALKKKMVKRGIA